jgi:hypothetical protein
MSAGMAESARFAAPPHPNCDAPHADWIQQRRDDLALLASE